MGDIYLLTNDKQSYEGVINLPIIDIEYINNEVDFQKYDCLVFTSKNSIYSLEYFNKDYKSLPSYCISKKTAKVLKKYNGNLQYIADSSNGDDFAKEIKNMVIDKRILYIRGSKILSNITDILKCDEYIGYKTICKRYDISKKPSKNSIIIFTSPSTIKCFLDNFKWDSSYRAISIGATTNSYLPKYINGHISEDLSIESCIKLSKII